MSDESVITFNISGENVITETIDAEVVDDTEVFKVPVNLDEHLGYQKDIKKFRSVLKRTQINIKPSWDRLNIKETSADQLEMQIQDERVKLILKRLIEKLKITGFLPLLVAHEGKILKDYMKIEDAQFILDKYNSGLRVSIFSSKKSLTKTKSKHSENQHVNDVSYQKMIELITENKCVSKYLNKLPFTDMDEFVLEFIRALEKFGAVLDTQLNLTAEEEQGKLRKFKQLYLEYCERNSNIKRLQQKLAEQSQETNLKLLAKDKIIQQYTSKVKVVRENFKERINDAVKASEKTMMIEAEKKEPKYQELAERAKFAQNKYTTVLEDHLENEKALRARRFKIEAQLANWLAKYDNDIGERHNQMEQLNEDFDIERAELNELECLFIEQEKLFNKYKKEKDAEDEAAFQEKLYWFVASRSARRIQRAWRVYKARKIARKKARKDRAKNKATKDVKKKK